MRVVTQKIFEKTFESITEKGINTNKSFWSFLQTKVLLVVTIKTLWEITLLKLIKKHLLAHLIDTTSILWR